MTLQLRALSLVQVLRVVSGRPQVVSSGGNKNSNLQRTEVSTTKFNANISRIARSVSIKAFSNETPENFWQTLAARLSVVVGVASSLHKNEAVRLSTQNCFFPGLKRIVSS